MSLKTNEIYEFGGFRLDVGERIIERLNEPAAGSLPDKTFEILVVLVRGRGHLISKDEILRQVWPDTFVEESNLEKRIHKLRQFLGEGEGGIKFIETVRKHGYRFVAPVRQVESSEAPVQDGSAAATGSKYHHHSAVRYSAFAGRPALLLGLSALLIVIFGIGYVFLIRPVNARPTKISLAILPLKPIDSRDRNELYEAGVADAIINRLNPSDRFTVRPLSAVRPYGDSDAEPLVAGREQQTSFVLASNYQVADGKIRITSDLINVSTGNVDDSYKVDAPTSSVFAVQDVAASQLATRLMSRFGSTRSASSAKNGTNDEEAYRLYLQGVNLQKKAGGDNQAAAVQTLKQALARDPNYAKAWGALASAYFSLSTTKRADGTEYGSSIDAANNALALDPNVAEAYSVFCINRYRYENDAAGGEAACKHAIELDPNSSGAHHTYSLFLSSQGRHDEAIAEIKTAIDIEPAHFDNQRWFANALYLARQYDEAIERYKKNIELDPRHEPTYNWLVRALEAKGREAEAFDYFIQSLTVQNTDGALVERYKTAFARAGWRGVLQERVQVPGETNCFRLAGWYARLGDKDKAFENLERGINKHEWSMMTIEVEPQLDPLRDDPRYASLLRRLRSSSNRAG